VRCSIITGKAPSPRKASSVFGGSRDPKRYSDVMVGPAVREKIEATGASLLYLPACSPDLNPIRKMRRYSALQGRASDCRLLRTKESLVEGDSFRFFLPDCDPGSA
jgi:hypothetical protein